MAVGKETTFDSKYFNEERGTTADSLSESSGAGIPLYIPTRLQHAAIVDLQLQLPITKHKRAFQYAVEKHGCTIVVGETGSGKSTQIPQFLYEAGWSIPAAIEMLPKQICVCQPRRIAAVTLSQRVAQETHCALGDLVGYQIRFERMLNDNRTEIKFVTNGILLNELQSSPTLDAYSVIVIDEVHERSIQTDLLLGFLRKIVLYKRPDLKLVISSATVDAKLLARFFAGDSQIESDRPAGPTLPGAAVDDAEKVQKSRSISTQILTVEGRMFPVQIFYLSDPCHDYLKETVETILKLHTSEPIPGDILAFLTGQDEIEAAIAMLKDRLGIVENGKRSTFPQLMLYPLYSSLAPGEQLRALQPVPLRARKAILSTNLAETSVTIDGVHYVIDCGFTKTRNYSVRLNVDQLTLRPVSKAAANQRAGRAGRVHRGKCYRLYTEDAFQTLNEFDLAEIQRTSLTGTLLTLKTLGIENVVRGFKWVAPPPSRHVAVAFDTLFALEAVDERGRLTELGRQISTLLLAVEQRVELARMLLKSIPLKCYDQILTIISMLFIENVFYEPSRAHGKQRMQYKRARHYFSVTEGDLLTFLNVYQGFCSNGQSSSWCGKNFVNYRGLSRAVLIRKQLDGIVRHGLKLKPQNSELLPDTRTLLTCIAHGLFMNAAVLHYDKSYRLVRDGSVSRQLSRPLSETAADESLALQIHPSSVLYDEYPRPRVVLFNQAAQSDGVYMRDLCVIESAEWLQQVVPHYYDFGTEREVDEMQRTRNMDGIQ